MNNIVLTNQQNTTQTRRKYHSFVVNIPYVINTMGFEIPINIVSLPATTNCNANSVAMRQNCGQRDSLTAHCQLVFSLPIEEKLVH